MRENKDIKREVEGGGHFSFHTANSKFDPLRPLTSKFDWACKRIRQSRYERWQMWWRPESKENGEKISYLGEVLNQATIASVRHCLKC